jgi:hypothetical protein
MDKSLRQEVWRRAGDVCEYCHLPVRCADLPFAIDHVIAQQHGGPTTSENLALACHACNSHKGPNIASLDPLTGSLTRLFDPRRDDWAEHFQWDGAKLLGRTAIGRATATLLAINHPDYVALRGVLMDAGLFPH